MNDVQTSYRQAYEALAAARFNLDGDFLKTAVNRAYYAAFYAARAALLSVGESPKTHAGAIQRFNLHFVKTGRVQPDVAHVFPYAEEARKGADYDALTVFDFRAVADLLADVERFVAAVEPLLSDPPATDL